MQKSYSICSIVSIRPKYSEAEIVSDRKGKSLIIFEEQSNIKYKFEN